jgi:hypothetical protein
MPFSSELIAQLATELHQSEQSRVQVEHFSKRYPGMTMEDGYAISRAWVAHKIAEGRTVRGHKIGLTSRAMQISSQIDEPDYGTLLDDMFFEPGDIPSVRFIAPRVEVELAFVLKRPLEGTGLTVDDVLDATEYVTPAIEIIDSRIEQFDRHTKVDAQSVRHHQRQRRQRRHHSGWQAELHRARVDLALVRCHPAAKRRSGRNRPGRWRARAPCHWRGLAGRQIGPLGRAAGGWRGGSWRARSPGPWPPRRAMCLTPTMARWAALPSPLFEYFLCKPPPTCSNTHWRKSKPKLGCGLGWPAPTPPKYARAPVLIGCCWTASTPPTTRKASWRSCRPSPPTPPATPWRACPWATAMWVRC